MLGESSEYYFKALSLLINYQKTTIKKFYRKKQKHLNGLGNIYLRINQTDDALLFLQKSLQIERQNNSILGQAKNLADIGSSFEEGWSMIQHTNISTGR
jgi:tetratricopeptide (TPR) repeat protein